MNNRWINNTNANLRAVKQQIALLLRDIAPSEGLSTYEPSAADFSMSPSREPPNHTCQIVRCCTALLSSKSVSPGATPHHNRLSFRHPNRVRLIISHSQTGLRDYSRLWKLEPAIKTRGQTEDSARLFQRAHMRMQARHSNKPHLVVYIQCTCTFNAHLATGLHVYTIGLNNVQLLILFPYS